MNKSIKLYAPSHWASYLVNGDDSGLSHAEKQKCIAWLKKQGLFDQYALSCENVGAVIFEDKLTDCEVYTFMGA